jgi:simple sugar transport system permease protein
MAWVFLVSVLRISVPYVMAALGGTASERAGVINIALEGLLLTAALGAAIGAPHGAAAALLCGLGAGVLLAACYGLLVVVLRGDQIVCGVGVYLFADGLSRFLLKVVYGSTSNSPRFAALEGPYTPVFVALCAAAPLGLWFYLMRTAPGLRLRAVGEHPEAARTLGIRVTRVRFGAVLLSGALTALGGVWLVFDQKQFVGMMSGGRGFIALAAMIFGGWHPLKAALAGLLFGAAEATGILLQAQGLPVPNWVIQMVPYVLTIAALAGRAMPALARGRGAGARRGGSTAPAALGQKLPR